MWKSILTSLCLILGGCDRSQSPSAFPARGPEDVAAAEGAPAPPPRDEPAAAKEAGKTVYVCPMHPEVVSDEPGTCPKCNMHLEPKPAPDGGGAHAHVHGATGPDTGPHDTHAPGAAAPAAAHDMDAHNHAH